MKKNEIKAGGCYVAKVSGKLTAVRVDGIRDSNVYRAGRPHTPVRLYDVANVATGRKLLFRSAAKFRGPAEFPAGKKFVPTPAESANDPSLAQVPYRMWELLERDGGEPIRFAGWADWERMRIKVGTMMLGHTNETVPTLRCRRPTADRLTTEAYPGLARANADFAVAREMLAESKKNGNAPLPLAVAGV